MEVSYLALLRGINVGGKNLVPMKDLAAMFVAAGCRDVRTYIQSGNVLFEADPEVAAALPGLVTAAILQRFGYRVPLVLRTVPQLTQVVGHNPFLVQGVADELLHVLFLADRPAEHRVAALDAQRSPPDAFIVQGQEVYLHLPHGAARTKLTNGYFDTKLATISTGRNWRTVTTLLALLQK